MAASRPGNLPAHRHVIGFRPIVETSMALMHHVWGDGGTRQYRFLHAQEGFGKAILESHRSSTATPAALLALRHQRRDHGHGPGVQGAGPEGHRRDLPAALVADANRHSSGKRLFEVADVVIDTGVPLEDASQRIEGLQYPVGPTSTSLAIAVGHAINAGTAEELVRRGHKPFIMVNTNTVGVQQAHMQNDKNYEELWRLLRNR